MHSLSASFILGYHGCSRSVAQALLDGEPFKPSDNIYDWLGPGAYFWEANPARGIEFFQETQIRKKRDPDDVAVVGAVIDMGYCLDLSSSRGVEAVKDAHRDLKAIFKALGKAMPRNKYGKDLLLRELDCGVISHLHASRKAAGLSPFDTVRGVFQEGQRAYPNSGFRARTHIQIAVCNLSKIKGVFRVPQQDL